MKIKYAVKRSDLCDRIEGVRDALEEMMDELSSLSNDDIHGKLDELRDTLYEVTDDLTQEK